MVKFKQIMESIRVYGEAGAKKANLETVEYLREHQQDTLTYLSEKFKRITMPVFVLAYAFEVKATLEEVQQWLEKDCAKLIPRNFPEVSLIYAFKNGLSFEEWLEVHKKVEDLSNNIKETSDQFKGGVTLSSLNEYVKSKSASNSNEVFSSKITKEIEKFVLNAKSEKELLDAVKLNIDHFTFARDRQRMYFIQYLFEYANSAVNTENDWILQNTDTNKEAKINFKNVFINFDIFYQNSITNDRLKVIFDAISTAKSTEDGYEKEIKTLLAEGSISNEEFEQLRIYRACDSEDDENKILTKRYSDYLRDIVIGKKDISRNMFMAIMTFFNCMLEESSLKFDAYGLNTMLEKSGWSPMKVEESDFDAMILDILQTPDNKDAIIADTNCNLTFEGLEPILYMVEGKGYNNPQQKQISNALK